MHMSRTVNAGKKAILGVDIGGTKFAYSVYEMVNGRIKETSIALGRARTEKGRDGLRNTMADIYNEAVEKTPGYSIDAIGIAAPGRPIAHTNAERGSFVVDPDTVGFLEKEPGEFADVDLRDILKGDIPKPVYVVNDAVAQMLAMVRILLANKGRTTLYGTKICYLG